VEFEHDFYLELIYFEMQLIVKRFLYLFVAIKKDVGSSNIEDCFPRGAFPAGDTKGWLYSCYLFWIVVCFVVTYTFVIFYFCFT